MTRPRHRVRRGWAVPVNVLLTVLIVAWAVWVLATAGDPTTAGCPAAATWCR